MINLLALDKYPFDGPVSIEGTNEGKTLLKKVTRQLRELKRAKAKKEDALAKEEARARHTSDIIKSLPKLKVNILEDDSDDETSDGVNDDADYAPDGVNGDTTDGDVTDVDATGVSDDDDYAPGDVNENTTDGDMTGVNDDENE
ncbi:hypothetical protein HDU85_006881 [Gaertneriomyces sp. JEL0708]|nr:hypothetical protein HDU85_006881 [Gaertneriomyces sp. JEL0708]